MSETRFIKGQDGQWYEIDSSDRDWIYGVSEEEMGRIKGIQAGQFCPGCSSDAIDIHDSIRECRSCNAIFTNEDEALPLDKALKIVNFREFETRRVDSYHNAYFDFYVKYPNGSIERIHGWFSNVTRRITQVG